MYIESSTIFSCLLREPARLDSQNKYPIVIGLQGGGSTPDVILSLFDKLPDINFIYVTPQAIFPTISGDSIVYDWANWPTGNELLIEKSFRISTKYIGDVIENISQRYNTGDIFLLGWSQGAIMAYLAGAKYSNLLKGLICMSGPGILSPLLNPFGEPSSSDWLAEQDIAEASKLRVFITHGSDDKLAKMELARKSAEVLKRYNHNVTLREFDGSHSFPPKDVLVEIVKWIGNS